MCVYLQKNGRKKYTANGGSTVSTKNRQTYRKTDITYRQTSHTDRQTSHTEKPTNEQREMLNCIDTDTTYILWRQMYLFRD